MLVEAVLLVDVGLLLEEVEKVDSQGKLSKIDSGASEDIILFLEDSNLFF